MLILPFKVLSYFLVTEHSGVAYSIDNVVFDFYIGNISAMNDFLKFISNLEICFAIRIKHWTSFKVGSFREQFSIMFHDGTSFWIGVGLNNGGKLTRRVRIDANPNKVGDHTVFKNILTYLIGITRHDQRTIKRFDLAIDIPVDRFSVFLIKDRRLYEERRHGKEWTQYLGQRNSIGRVKLYNKTVEADLDFEVTRLEITLSPDVSDFSALMPQVFYIKETVPNIYHMATLNETDRFILSALLTGAGKLEELSRKKRERFSVIMKEYATQLIPHVPTINSLLEELRTLLTPDCKWPVGLWPDQPPNPPAKTIYDSEPKTPN